MADLEFIADYSDLQTMRRELVGVAKDAKQSAGVFEREYRKVERQLASSAKANQTFFNSVLGVDREMKSASKSADVFTRELQRQEKATEAYNKETQRLKLQYNSTYRAAQSFKTQLGELNEAHRRGAISTDRHEQQVRELKTEYRAFLNGTASGMNQFGNIASKNTRVMKRFGAVGMQQVGYQVQDFAVQVQSGTSAMVALGQQGSQLLGIFGAKGAIAGMILAIGTGLAGAFMAAKKASEDATGAALSYKKALKGLQEQAKSLNGEMLKLRYNTEDVSQAQAMQTLAEVEREIADVEAKIADLRSQGAAGAMQAGTENTRLGILEDQKQALEDQLANIEAIIRKTEGWNALREMQRAEDERADAVDRIVAAYNAELLTQERRVVLAQAAVRYGQESLEYRRLQAQIEEEILRAELAQNDILGNNADEIVRAYRAANQLEASQEALQGTSRALQTIWTNIKDRVSSAADEAVRFSGNLALGQDFLNAQIRANVESGVLPPQALEDLPPTAAETAYQAFLEDKRRAARSSSSGGGGSVASGASAAADQVDRLNQALTENEKLMLSVGETVASSFGDALMSIVDGSKSAADAFRDMARRILKQAFDMLVVQPIMNSIMGVFSPGPGMSMGAASSIVSQLPQALLQANGGVWNKGVQMYADGGVVNGATAFAHSGGLGVMGEAGPEAIMPLKRGKNGKLGVSMEGASESPVNVYQTININGNGDEYIMGKIQQAAPQLANYTQQQMLDQRRRGGVVKSTFG
jgi:hypothetical protein